MDLHTSYTVKPKGKPHVWLFKYDLEGRLKLFEILGGVFTEDVVKFLFTPTNFPFYQKRMEEWIIHYKKSFEILKGEIDLSFESFWNTYNYKHGKKMQTQKIWAKLSKKDKINAIIGISKYENHLREYNGQAKAYPSTYLNQRYWENYVKAS